MDDSGHAEPTAISEIVRTCLAQRLCQSFKPLCLRLGFFFFLLFTNLYVDLHFITVHSYMNRFKGEKKVKEMLKLHHLYSFSITYLRYNFLK